MRLAVAASFLVLARAVLSAQAPAQASYIYSDPVGFSYAVPADWEVVDARASLPQLKEKASQAAAGETEKKGVACVQVGLTARHGDPASVIVVETLPFDCFGQQLTQDDLPEFGTGAFEGLKQNFDLVNPEQSAYALGSHHLWIERAQGAPKGQPGKRYTVELACGLLTKAAVCWMAMASDAAALAVFEQSAVTLDSDPPTALVPATVFKQ